jgi:two-component system cell cycle sensor histidine kinase/response regulator CckA
LLCDVVMPGLSSQAVTEQLSQKQPGLKLLFMSGYTDEMIARQGILASEVPFLPKPFSPTVLARKVREVLDAP